VAADHPPPSTLGWPGRVAVGIVRGDPTQVFLAESDAVLGRLLALRLVASSPASELEPSGLLGEIRQALLEERWGDAVELWMRATGEIIDVYPDESVVSDEVLGIERAAAEVRLSPAFDGEPGT
jgi:hypothetical protein